MFLDTSEYCTNSKTCSDVAATLHHQYEPYCYYDTCWALCSVRDTVVQHLTPLKLGTPESITLERVDSEEGV